jgi:hypothetical protein
MYTYIWEYMCIGTYVHTYMLPNYIGPLKRCLSPCTLNFGSVSFKKLTTFETNFRPKKVILIFFRKKSSFCWKHSLGRDFPQKIPVGKWSQINLTTTINFQRQSKRRQSFRTNFFAKFSDKIFCKVFGQIFLQSFRPNFFADCFLMFFVSSKLIETDSYDLWIYNPRPFKMFKIGV